MSPNVWATIMPFGPVTLIFYWPQKNFSDQPKLPLISGTGHIKSNNSGTAKVKIVKKERDPPLVIKFQNIPSNTTQVIVRHRICLQTDEHGETSIPPTTSLWGV